MTYSVVVGVDPGPIPGVVMLGRDETTRTHAPNIFQCDPGTVLWLIRTLLTLGPEGTRRVLAVERFIIGMRSSKLSTPRAAAVTRDMVGAVTELGRELDGVEVVQRCAGEVMPWASDKRLKAAGLLDTTKAMPHARAAAQHALFAAVRDGGMTDPLSTKVRAP